MTSKTKATRVISHSLIKNNTDGRSLTSLSDNSPLGMVLLKLFHYEVHDTAKSAFQK